MGDQYQAHGLAGTFFSLPQQPAARRFPPPWIVEEHADKLHRPRRERAGARLFLFRGGVRSALSGKAAHQGRCAADGGQLRQTAGATAAADLIQVKSPRHRAATQRFGRYWGTSGQYADIVNRLLMTHICHRAADFAVMHNVPVIRRWRCYRSRTHVYCWSRGPLTARATNPMRYPTR